MNNSPPDQKTKKLNPSVTSARPGGKEMEATARVAAETVSEISTEIEIPHEVVSIGVVQTAETIELPPDVKNLGMTQVGAATPVTPAAAVTPVTLPLSDAQVVTGLSANVSLAIRWLAVWCTKKLKKAHVVLKVVHGKIVRVRQ
jgi:hypothetical protein